MEYSRIVAVTGLSGLYEIISSKTDGAVVRSLEDGSTKFVSSRVHNLSHLESIEIYTSGENTSLGHVFTAMKDNAEAKPDVKDTKALKSYFETVYPDMDFDRVYASDMKKMVNWYAVLEKHDIDFVPKEAAEEGGDETAGGENNVAETLEAAGEKVVMNVTADTVPEVAETKTTKTRKKKTDNTKGE